MPITDNLAGPFKKLKYDFETFTGVEIGDDTEFQIYTGVTDLAILNLSGSVVDLQTDLSGVQTEVNNNNLWFQTYTGSTDNTILDHYQRFTGLLYEYQAHTGSNFLEFIAVESGITEHTELLTGLRIELDSLTGQVNINLSAYEIYTGTNDTSIQILTGHFADLQTSFETHTGAINPHPTYLLETTFQSYTGVTQSSLETLSGDVVENYQRYTGLLQNYQSTTGIVSSNFITFQSYTGTNDSAIANLGGTVVTNYQLHTGLQSAFQVYTGTNDGIVSSLSGSMDTAYSNLDNLTSAYQVTTGIITNNYTEFQTYTGTNDTSITTLSGTVVTNIQILTGLLTSFQQYTGTTNDNAISLSGSVDTAYSNLNSLTNAHQITTGIVTDNYTGFQTYTGTLETRFTTISGESAAHYQRYTGLLSAYQTTTGVVSSNYDTFQTYTGYHYQEYTGLSARIDVATGVTATNLIAFQTYTGTNDASVTANYQRYTGLLSQYQVTTGIVTDNYTGFQIFTGVETSHYQQYTGTSGVVNNVKSTADAALPKDGHLIPQAPNYSVNGMSVGDSTYFIVFYCNYNANASVALDYYCDLAGTYELSAMVSRYAAGGATAARTVTFKANVGANQPTASPKSATNKINGVQKQVSIVDQATTEMVWDSNTFTLTLGDIVHVTIIHDTTEASSSGNVQVGYVKIKKVG